MPKLLITRGLPGSGKTTFARAWINGDVNRVRVNRDDLRRVLFDGEGVLPHAQEQQVTIAQQTLATNMLRGGIDVVIDDTNLRNKYLIEWLEIARREDAEVEWHDEFLAVPVEECVRRDRARGHAGERSVGEPVITKMHDRYLKTGHLERPDLPPKESAARILYTGTPGKPATILVDVDGTVALNGESRNKPNRGWFEWDRVKEDRPNEPIIELVKWLHRAGLHVVFMSGRDAVCYEDTFMWLDRHVGPVFDDLYMRPKGDNRKDSIIKTELFDQYVRDNFDVKLVIDDRNQVVDQWRALGLTVAQIAEGNF